MGRPAIFLDRDGVLNENRSDYVKNWEEFTFLPGALQALRALSQLNLPIFVVTNQAVVNRELVPRALVDQIHRRMISQIRHVGAAITQVFYCPHLPSEGCGCRKPAPGLLLSAAAQFDIELSRSVLVGDANTDILAGQRAGCMTVLVLTGRGQEALRSLAEGLPTCPTAITNDLTSAVPIITALLQRGPIPLYAMAPLAASPQPL